MIFLHVFMIILEVLYIEGQSQIKCYHCANVTHTYDCLNTQTCFLPYESCFIHANYENGKTDYTQGCMSAHLCERGTIANIVGRSVDSIKRQQEFAEFECCSGDLCNIHDTEVSGLVFKVSTHIGAGEVLKAWTNGVDTVSRDYCRNVRTYGCSKHYRHPAVDNWLGIRRDLIKYALYVDEKEVAYIWFNGTGSSLTDWFSHDRVINSSWTDLSSTNTYIFSIDGSGWFRRFSVEKHYGGCAQDFGWTVIITDKNPTYCDYDDLNVDPPYILYSKANKSGHFLEDFVQADATAVYIYNTETEE